MAEKESTLEDSGRLRRAKPAYVITVTVLTVGFWWLFAVSQTTLGERHAERSRPRSERRPAAAEAKPALPAEPTAADATPAEDYTSRLVTAMEEADEARRAVAAARTTLAAAQQRWEEWLAGREAREREMAAAVRAQQPAPPVEKPAGKSALNPQYVELTKQLQKLTMERDELLQRLTPEHPSVVDVNTRITAVGQQLASVPELITPVAEPAAETPVAVQPAEPPAADPQALAAEAARNESELREAWDAAQIKLDELTLAEQQATERYESLREAAARQSAAAAAVAARPATPPPSSPPPVDSEETREADTNENWHLGLALGVLALAELGAVRLALLLMAAEKAVPLVSVAQVTALLPVPVLATFPARSPVQPTSPSPGSVTALTVWLLVCEGTMVVMTFLLAALAMRDTGFAASMASHPIESMAQGLRDLAQ